MIEASAHQIKEEELAQALTRASEEITKLENFQKDILKDMGLSNYKRVLEQAEISQESIDLFNQNILPKMKEVLFAVGLGKSDKGKGIGELHETWEKLLKEKYPDQNNFLPEEDLFDKKENEILHEEAIQADKRVDGRPMDKVRNLYAQAGGISSVLHGSGMFYRGETHVLSVLTLGGPEDRNLIDSMQTKVEKRFMHHYNFPPYSTGEVGRSGFTSRREVGHGALAEKALAMVLPTPLEFPYTIRVVSESMASNGSTSQASICASTLALMDGGVPIKAPVAGIAMGLMYQDENQYKILTDIQGPEDHHGDMDFKVAGTRAGVTAIQLDVKVKGVSIKILTEALNQAQQARNQILDQIEKEISAPRKDISPNAPKIIVSKIKVDQIGAVIGTGGKVIKEIQEKTGAVVTIEEDGTIYFTGKNGSAEAAQKMVEEITHEWKVGEVIKGTVVKIAEFGAFVKLNASTDGLVHVSEIAPFRVEMVSDLLKEKMIVPVKIIKIDSERNKISLSIKEADPNFFKSKK
jgi:polyribonucleotide nucleotidyltransferase